MHQPAEGARGPPHQGASLVDVGRTSRIFAAVFGCAAVWCSCATKYGGLLRRLRHRQYFAQTSCGRWPGPPHNTILLNWGGSEKDLREISQQALVQLQHLQSGKGQRGREYTNHDTRGYVCRDRLLLPDTRISRMTDVRGVARATNHNYFETNHCLYRSADSQLHLWPIYLSCPWGANLPDTYGMFRNQAISAQARLRPRPACPGQ